MKASRRSTVITNASDSPQGDGWLGLLRRQANNILTLLLVIAAIIMLIRWRMRSAAEAKDKIGDELSSAQSLVSELRDLGMRESTPQDMIKRANIVQSNALSSISDVLNSSDADASMRAQALLARGDLYWYLANLPPMPAGTGASPALASSESGDAMLQKAWDAYQEVAKNSTYADRHDALAAAHLGLAAIAENRAKTPADWATARTEFEAVTSDTKAPQPLIGFAQAQLAAIPTLQDRYFLVPPQGTPDTQPTTQPATLPTKAPAMIPTTVPASVPTSMPVVVPMTMEPVKK